jgi:hypothetical protein
VSINVPDVYPNSLIFYQGGVLCHRHVQHLLFWSVDVMADVARDMQRYIRDC